MNTCVLTGFGSFIQPSCTKFKFLIFLFSFCSLVQIYICIEWSPASLSFLWVHLPGCNNYSSIHLFISLQTSRSPYNHDAYVLRLIWRRNKIDIIFNLFFRLSKQHRLSFQMIFLQATHAKKQMILNNYYPATIWLDMRFNFILILKRT